MDAPGEHAVHDPRRLALDVRARRLAIALLLYDDLGDPRPAAKGPPEMWRGTCTECGRHALELSHTAETITLQCMLCGHQPNWRKLEQDVFLPRWDGADPHAVEVAVRRDALLKPVWLRPADSDRYDELDETDKRIWNETRGQIPPSHDVWIAQLANAVTTGLITLAEAQAAGDRYDEVFSNGNP